MPIFHITYSTHNVYSARVREAVLDFLVLPEIWEQGDASYIVETKPNASYYIATNVFGFKILRFRLKDISEFDFSISFKINQEEINPFNFVTLPFDEERSTLLSDSLLIDNYLFLSKTEYTCLPGSFEYPQLEADEPIFAFIQRVNRFVFSYLTYDKTIIDPNRKPDVTIEEKRGVCQDYAHLMLGILRNNKVSARYVSGYLNQGKNLEGAGAVHAWIQALIPGVGWIGFDPTNNLLEDHHYIKIAHGVDISDCTTLKGVIKGIVGTNSTDYQVLIEEQNKLEANQ